MALTSCKECGHEISTEAAFCPQCGAAQTKKLRLPLFIGVLFLPIVFYWFIAFGRYSRRDKIAGGVYIAICILVTGLIDQFSTERTPSPPQVVTTTGVAAPLTQHITASNQPQQSDSFEEASNQAATQPVIAETTASDPQFDTINYCKKLVNDGAGGSYSLEETCRNTEAESRKELLQMHVPNRVQNYCHDLMGSGSEGSYSLMVTCIQTEMESKARLDSR